jgi:NAD(P)-dependent dehydrogenase (short-subunit alcohol dehydrogenase family)
MNMKRRYALAEMPRTALVTGAAKRIGRVIAGRLAAEGWTVGLHYNGSAADAADAVAAIEAAGGRAQAFQADLSDEAAASGLMDRVAAALGPVGALVNNASTFEFDDAATADRARWDLHMEVNLRAPFVLTQALARQLPEDRRGHVVNMIDQRVLSLTPYFVTYSISKFGLWGMTQCMALALAPRIQVNGIGPGPTLRGARQSEAHFAQQNEAMPLGHGAEPEEIADAVLYLLSAPSITGTLITVDGGQHLAWAQPGQRINPLD